MGLTATFKNWPSQLAIVVDHCGGPLWWAIVVGHCGGPLWWAIVVGHCGFLPLRFFGRCEFFKNFWHLE
jgi:hypothetical protein